MDEKLFTWTQERTLKMFELRFKNDNLFKKKRQPWKEFRNILLQNGYPEEMTVDHIRKKWSYTYDCYKIAKKAKNKKWLYYKRFDKHFRKNKALDKYDAWNDDWRLKLINIVTKAMNFEDHNIVWRLVETELRSQDMPEDCFIQDIRHLWHHLQVTFHRKYRLKLKNGPPVAEWPLYDVMLNYYQTFEPNTLSGLKEEGVVIPRIRHSSHNYMKKKLKTDSENNENGEFHWNRDITETFIQLRLQHEWLFREKKWAWKDFSEIMCKEYGFPTYLSGRMLNHKWSSIYGDYQKAKATANTGWLYYNLFEAYLGDGSLSIDPLKNWTEEWIIRFIFIRAGLEQLFYEVEQPRIAWREVEKQLRCESLPTDHSLLDLPELWLQLIKTYRWKRKFATKGTLNEKWPFYDAMTKYMDVKSHNNTKNAKKLSDIPIKNDNLTLNMNNDVDMYDDDFEDDIKLFDLKKKLETVPETKYEAFDENTCRACGNDDACVNLLEAFNEDGLDLTEKLKLIGGIEIDTSDSFPKQICFVCLKDLENAYKFRKKCQDTDDQLRNIKKIAVKIEINIDSDQKDTIKEKLEDCSFQDDSVFDNNVADIEDRALLENERKHMVKTIEKKIIKNIPNKPRKKYTYDYSRVCEVCGKRTKNIKNHMDSHATEKCYTCEECGKKFKFKSGLVIHKATHNPTPKKTCEVCGKTFHVLAHYRKHFVYHANERKFSCETCGKSFHTREILTVHMRMHTDERPFSCQECGKTFRTSGCVSRHRRIVHKKNGKNKIN